ncbi:MAG: hypothetical protein LAT55_07300 [Opitutales bacterium]|nr:hypothetical protein [Opitutales bacterium]
MLQKPLFATLALSWLAAASYTHAEPVSVVEDDGTVHINQVEVDKKYLNPTTDEIEARFREFYNEILRMETRREDGSFGGPRGNRYAENEKRSYPSAKMHVLAGNVESGMNFLQAEDQPQNPRDNVHTKGIDLYWAFTLKGQVRKFFQFGHLMEDEYRERMAEAISLWTESHPRFTPHPEYGSYDPDAQGWGPNRFGHRQVDGRRTDNMYAMSTGSIYLFAEASGNEETRKRAKSEILGYVWALYNIGHGEWDSIAYHSHIVAPFLNIYDFAEDPEVKMAAKLALDHFFTSAALKWERATFLGASKRDYGGGSYHQMGNGFTHFFNLYFQDSDEVHFEPDQVHAMTSKYRPPPAVRALAARKFDRPVEIRATKPQYENWQEGRSDRPHNFETIYIGNHGGIGSTLDPGENGDLAPFRAILHSGDEGTEVFALSPDRTMNRKFRGSQTAQYKNLVVWMSDKRDRPWHLYRTEGTEVEKVDGITFIKSDRSWLALRSHGVGDFEDHSPEGRRNLRNPSSKWWTAEHQEDWNFISVEYAEEGDFDSFADFRDAVLEQGNIEIDVENRQVILTGANGRVLETHYNDENDLAVVIADGELRDWDDPANWALWQTTGDQNLISLGWKEGHLKVEAGGKVFEANFELDDFTGPEVTREQLERERELTATSSFENR